MLLEGLAGKLKGDATFLGSGLLKGGIVLLG